MSNLKRTKTLVINDVHAAKDSLTGRAGLDLLARHLHGIALFPRINRLSGSGPGA